MSLDSLDKDQLRKIANELVLDVEDDASEEDLRAAVDEVPVEEVALSFPEYAELLGVEQDDEDDEDDSAGLITSSATPKKGVAKKAAAKKTAAKKTATTRSAPKTVVPENYTLLKMTRNNPVYEVRGYRFERNAPFVLVKDDDVDFLCEVEGGFTLAKPSEVQKFYN